MNYSRFFPTGRELTRLMVQVHSRLRPGKAAAITGNELARALREPDDRKIRIAIRELIRGRVAVGSSVGEPAGYYIVANADEALENIRVLGERKKEVESRLEDFKAAVAHMSLPEQMSLI